MLAESGGFDTEHGSLVVLLCRNLRALPPFLPVCIPRPARAALTPADDAHTTQARIPSSCDSSTHHAVQGVTSKRT